MIKNIMKIALLIVVSILFFSGSANADNAPRPEQGSAVGTVTYNCVDYDSSGKQVRIPVEYAVNIVFWNVGAKGGAQYKDMSVKLSGSSADACLFTDKQKNFVVTFSGGPDGTAKNDKGLNGEQFTFVDGRNITITGQGGKITGSAIVQNPEIFSKYNWDTSGVSEDKPEDSGARFSSISGSVKIIPPGATEDDWQYAKPNQVLLEGTRIITGDGKNDMVILTFADKSTLMVPSDSEIVVPKLNKPKTSLEVFSGRIKANIIKPLLSGEGFNVRTNHSVTAIKGTIFVVEATPDVTLIKVIEGSVAFKSKASGKTETVNTGETIIADKNGLGQKTTFDVNAENAKWKDLTGKIGKTGGNSTNYLYFGIPAILLAIAAAFYILKRKKK